MEDISVSTSASAQASPEQRPSSQSPSVSPSLAIGAVPLLDRSVSTPSDSSGSTLSTRSRQSRLSDGASTVVKRRGYMRPQGTAFADSARNRDSVMSLGSIAHMQYYFARTGLLDGKGAQLAKDKKRTVSMGDKENFEPAIVGTDDLRIPALSLYDRDSSYPTSDPGFDGNVIESPTDMSGNWSGNAEPQMLPPTVSTYKQKPSYTEPLPDMPVLRRELKEALQDACKVIEETQKQQDNPQDNGEAGNGFHEIQGLHILDILTLAIRAAKNYYTAHSQPMKLYALRSEKHIRADLYQVLDILKRMASRNFRGGMRSNELIGIIVWIESIDKLLKGEEEQEQAEAAERDAWLWREGDWSGRERERECLFLKSFDNSGQPLPQWHELTPERTLPDDFLRKLQDGQRLIQFHNALVSRSRRQFHAIKLWHTDVAKPYRMAENLRYWIKAAELRWEVKLVVPVSDIVNNKDDPEVWRKFDEAVLLWSQRIRIEMMEELRHEVEVCDQRRPPELHIEVPDSDDNVAVPQA
ncbi:hypothetical protein LTR62_002474 [Meristemomyces frigidus]|uniref:Uncharacterized protein n=1 Tax=Meristemomyces frigidus TaxID=1508187 RepID=A0AAN7TJM4_9PEZI|nr:hypothetical protein LTR62_002474 [Meristemomyces frigidus]